MNPTRLLPAAALLLLLAASTPVTAEPGRTAPPSQSGTLLSTNYRLTLAAKSGDKALGEISLLTCAPAIDASGFLDKPADETLPAATLTLRGRLEELEGGTLLMTYTFGVSTPVVSQTMHAPVRRADPDAKAGEAKPEPRTVGTTMISFRDHFSTGALRLKPGTPYELMSMAGVVYSLTLTPEPQK